MTLQNNDVLESNQLIKRKSNLSVIPGFDNYWLYHSVVISSRVCECIDDNDDT